MGHSIEKYRLLEVIHKVYMLNGLDVLATQKDLEKILGRSIDLEYLKRVVERFRARNRTTADAAANIMVECLIAAHESKMAHHYNTLRAVAGRERALKSICCNMPVTTTMVNGKKRYYCDKCYHETKTIDVLQKDEIEQKNNALREIREDLKATVENLVKIRDGARLPSLYDIPPQPMQFNFFQGGKIPKFTKEELLAFEQAKNLAPQDREKLVKKVEAQLVDYKLKELEEEGIIPPEDKDEQR
jgi:hypothetical protein